MAREFKFLLLDDDPDIRFLHRRALQQGFRGCAVIETLTCHEALAALTDAAAFDAVISDHQLQGPSGAECIGLMRARGLTCPILLVTSSDDPRVHQKACQSGATRVFPPDDTDFVAFLRTKLLS
jgi:CheY-like chemotaxis protein